MSRSGSIHTIMPLPGTIETGARAIPETGIVTGSINYPVPYVNYPSEGEEAYRYTVAGATRRLGKCPGAYLAFPQAINNAGQIVGLCRYDYGDRAAMVVNGAMTEIYNLVEPASRVGWTFPQAKGINNQGQIVGWGSYYASVRPFLLTPRSTPDTSVPNGSSVTVNPSPVAINTSTSLTSMLTGTGGSGLAQSEYRIDSGPYIPFGAPSGDTSTVAISLPAFSSTGVRNVCVRAKDAGRFSSDV